MPSAGGEIVVLRARAQLPNMTSASASASSQSVPDFTRFAIGFDHRDRERLHALIDEVLDSLDDRARDCVIDVMKGRRGPVMIDRACGTL